ncbi:MAG: ribosomal protein L7/L12 [Bacteroidales bacterium]|nr:ribosomal protein L7/L12 [Bacteroidales bacterium]MBN2758516.1 ribosomal protein L7/L12 [Bacteroidales bacterium]
MQVKLTKVGNNKIELIKLIRWITSLGLKESNEIVNNTPSIFEIKDENADFEKIKNNFTSIGALIEIYEPEKPDSHVGGAETHIIIENNEQNLIFIENEEQNPEPLIIEKDKDFFEKIDERADAYAFTKAIKSALIFSTISALIYSLSVFYFSHYFGYLIILIVGIGNAIILKNGTKKEDINIAKIAAGLTFFFYIPASLFKNIVFSYIYHTLFGFSGFFFGIFNSNIFIILIAMSISYYLVAKKSPFDAFVITNKKTQSTKKDDKYRNKSKNINTNKTKSIKREKKKF